MITSLKTGPVWPTLRGAKLHGAEDTTNLGSGPELETVYMWLPDLYPRLALALPDLIYRATGFHRVVETANGGFHPSGTPKWYPTFSFEMEYRGQKKLSGTHGKVYVIGWLGGYGNGSILHMAPQWPHLFRYSEKVITQCMLTTYRRVVAAAYADRPIDRNVRRFLE